MNTKRRSNFNRALSRLPKGLRKRIYDNIQNDRYDPEDYMKYATTNSDNLGGYLSISFTWSETEEEGTFWVNIKWILDDKNYVTTEEYKQLKKEYGIKGL